MKCSAETRADGILRIAAAEVSRAHPSAQSKPGKWFEFIVNEKTCQAAGSGIAFGERHRVGHIVVNDPEKLAVSLVEAIEAGLHVVPSDVGAEADLSAGVGGSVMISGGKIDVGRGAVVVRRIPVIEGR